MALLTRRWVLILLTALLCVGCDQSTKRVASVYLPKSQAFSYFADTVRFQYAENEGAFLSMGAGLHERWRGVLFQGAVAVGLSVLLAYLLLAKSLALPAIVSGALVLSGGVSNLIDRLMYDGRVIDFLNVGIGPLRTGIFNVADMAILFGALLFIVSDWRAHRHERKRVDAKG